MTHIAKYIYDLLLYGENLLTTKMIHVCVYMPSLNLFFFSNIYIFLILQLPFVSQLSRDKLALQFHQCTLLACMVIHLIAEDEYTFSPIMG